MRDEFVCSFCNKKFSGKFDFNQHERIHTGERPYPCTFGNCDKAFKQRQHLKDHERTHTGEKPFTCKDCERDFSRRDSLRRHMKNKHPELLPANTSNEQSECIPPSYEQDMQQATQQSLITAYQHGDIPGPSNLLQTAQSGGAIRRQPFSTSQRPAPYRQPAPQEVCPTLRSLLENPSSPRPPTRQRSPSPYDYPRGAPRPPSRSPSPPLLPTPPVYNNPTSAELDDAMEYVRSHTKKPSPQR